jgi:serine/threonine protein kinase
VLHRDISPANVLWSKARQQLQLIDFDFACRMDQNKPLDKGTPGKNKFNMSLRLIHFKRIYSS